MGVKSVWGICDLLNHGRAGVFVKESSNMLEQGDFDKACIALRLINRLAHG